MASLAVAIGLSLVAALSPLLTFAALWQLKEWRWDRLREHLGREGALPLLFGKMRPLILIIAILPSLTGYLSLAHTLTFALAALASLAALQVAARRQPLPVWTAKALALLAMSFTLDIALALLLSSLSPTPTTFLVILPFVQPPILAFAWLLLFPIDRRLKRRTFERARLTRKAHPHLRVIGITGSVGKTTTKELLAHILKDLYPLATPAHVNSEMGVARWLTSALANIHPDATIPVIVEMGAYRPGEIALLCNITSPQFGIVTFVGSQHLALFGSQQALIHAKGELLASLPSDGKAFINGDCALCRDMLPLAHCPVTIVSTGGSSDIEATDIEETTQGIRCMIGDSAFAVPLHGTHNVTNVLLAVAVAQSLGLPRSDIATRLKTFSPPHHTFEVRSEAGITILDDTHNASATSFSAAISWAQEQPYERKILLSSGLIELGEEHARTHRELGSLSASVFSQAIFLNRKSAEIFAEGYGKPVSLYNPRTVSPLPAGSLLVCIGRMPPSIISRFLP